MAREKKQPEGVVHDFDYWKDQISSSLEDPDYKKFIDRGIKIEKKYLDKRDSTYEGTSLNLFHSNIVTLRSMLFGQSPRVNVDRRHDDEDDDVARVGTEMLERMLNNDIGLRADRYAFALRKALDDYLIVGMGQCRIRYEATIGEDNVTKNETAPTDYVYWKDFLWSPCRNWDECRWVAFRSHLMEKEVIAAFGQKASEEVEYKSRKLDEDEAKKDNLKCAEIWEIWCKETKSVYWISVGGVDYILKTLPDPLKLKDFLPCPQPMMANLTNTKLMPTADYVFAQDLYSEIDVLETRIILLTKAAKVVGVYDKSSEGIKRMLKEGCENEMIPVDNWAMFAEKGGLKGQVDWLPIAEVVGAIEKLREYRDEAILLLYQVTGMSDIMRGQSTERRTSATEQSLKAKFASVRIQFMQDMFANFATDLQILKADIISQIYDPNSILKQSNMKFDEKNMHLISPAIQMIKNRDEIIWRVRVRPESVAMVDYAQLKQERTEFINALAIFFQSAVPLFQQDPTSAPYMFKLLQWGLAGFKGSQQIEGVMDQAIQHAMQRNAQQGNKPSPEEQKMQMEQQKMQGDMKMQLFEAQLDKQKMQMEASTKQMEFMQKMEQDKLKFQQEMKQDQQKFMLEMQQLMMKGDIQMKVAEQDAQTKMMTASVDAELQEDAHIREQARADDAAEREAKRPNGQE